MDNLILRISFIESIGGRLYGEGWAGRRSQNDAYHVASEEEVYTNSPFVLGMDGLFVL